MRGSSQPLVGNDTNAVFAGAFFAEGDEAVDLAQGDELAGSIKGVAKGVVAIIFVDAIETVRMRALHRWKALGFTVPNSRAALLVAALRSFRELGVAAPALGACVGGALVPVIAKHAPAIVWRARATAAVEPVPAIGVARAGSPPIEIRTARHGGRNQRADR